MINMESREIEENQLNAEENYMTTPISVLSYIRALEKQNKQQIECIEHIKEVCDDYEKQNKQLLDKFNVLKRDYIALESVSKQLTEHIDFLNDEIEELKSKLILSEQKVKLNYNCIIELQSELKAADSVNEGLSKSKLEILNEVKFSFDIHSDFSSQCNGYKSLCKQIEHLTNLKQTNKFLDNFEHPKQVDGEIEAVDALLNTFGQFCTLNGIKLTDSNKVGQAVIDFLKSDIYEIFKNQK